MSLNMNDIVAIDDEQNRMLKVWELIADKEKKIPARIIFHVENPLDEPGWRWAPRSFISSSPESSIDASTRRDRFNPRTSDGELWGIHSEEGLCVRFPGLILDAQPRLPGAPFHPWEGVYQPREDYLVFQNQTTKKWYQLADCHHSWKTSTQAKQEQDGYDKAADNPLCSTIHAGRCAIIRDVGSLYGVLVHILESDPNSPTPTSSAYRVRIQRRVMIWELNESQALVAITFRKIADRLMGEDVTLKLLRTSDHNNEEYENISQLVHKRNKELMKEAWDSNPEFAQAVVDFYSPHLNDDLCSYIPRWFSHDLIAEGLDEQAWIVG